MPAKINFSIPPTPSPPHTMKDVMAQIFQRAAARNLGFLLVGGHAMILHGVPRFTRDIDILISERIRDAWHALLLEVGYVCRHQTHAFDQFRSPAGARYHLPDFDLMIVDDEVWNKLSAAAVPKELTGNICVSVPDPLHLIAMKAKAAASLTRRNDAQDIPDIVHLIRVQGMTLEDPTLKATITKYGGEATLRRVEQQS